MNGITIGKMRTVTGIASRHVYLQWEEAIGIKTPRKGDNRTFPERLVNNLAALKALLDEMDLPLGEWLQWEHRLDLRVHRDEWAMFDLSADPYWPKYFKRLQKDMAEATVDLDELLRWEWELALSYPRDAVGNRVLNRDWIRYLQTVQEKYAEGWNVYDVRQGLLTPDQVRPQYAQANAYGPEF